LFFKKIYEIRFTKFRVTYNLNNYRRWNEDEEKMSVEIDEEKLILIFGVKDCQLSHIMSIN